jgi:uncharacterized protein (DUF1800 family)
MTKKAVLTEQDIAALASGAPAAGAVDLDAATIAAARAEAEAQEAARVVAEVEAAALKAAADLAAAELAAKSADKVESDLVAFLNAQVKEKDAALTAAAVEASNLKAQLAGIEATHKSMTDLVRASVGKMQIALGGSALDLSALTDVQVLAEHTRVAADFTSKFKVGGVAMTVPTDKPESESVVADPLQAARLAAVKSATK